MAFTNEFKTTIPTLFNLPELEGNTCEGVVIRPIVTSFLRKGSRILIKNKNENWAENNNYMDRGLLSRLLHEEEELSDEVTFLFEEMYKHIIQNRLTNLISKIRKSIQKRI